MAELEQDEAEDVFSQFLALPGPDEAPTKRRVCERCR